MSSVVVVEWELLGEKERGVNVCAGEGGKAGRRAGEGGRRNRKTKVRGKRNSHLFNRQEQK